MDIHHIDTSLLANLSSIKTAANITGENKEAMNVKSFFFQGIGMSAKGIALVGGACRRDGLAVNINSLWTEENSELNTARVWVHELGHQVHSSIEICFIHI